MNISFGYWMPLGSGGMVISNLPQRTDWTLKWNAKMAQIAEKVGYDYGLAPARFIASHGWEFQQEPTVCTAVLAAQTERIKLISAVHTGLWHPAMVAKQLATIDVYSEGRAAVNILSGWFKGEYVAFGASESMFYSEAGQFETTYLARTRTFRLRQERVQAFAVLALAAVAVPWLGDDYWLTAILIPFLILSLAGLGLNLLTGFAGQLSVGTAAFMAVGAYTAYNVAFRLPGGAAGQLCRRRPGGSAARGHHRLTELEDQGLLPGRHHSRAAVLRGVGVHALPLVFQRQRLCPRVCAALALAGLRSSRSSAPCIANEVRAS